MVPGHCMVGIICHVIMTLAPPCSPFPLETSQYLKMRDDLIAEDEHMRLGGHLVLSEQEQTVNKLLMQVSDQ